MRYLIDTNICIYLMNQRPIHVIRKFRECSPGTIVVSSITVSELQYGVAKSTHQKKNQLRLDEFLMPLAIIDYDEAAARIYGKVRAELEREGRLIGPLDMLIAAHALEKHLTLVTNNEEEFNRVKNLNVENWSH
jgi:tRNA(fMet)-specific endonuclease VapC